METSSSQGQNSSQLRTNLLQKGFIQTPQQAHNQMKTQYIEQNRKSNDGTFPYSLNHKLVTEQNEAEGVRKSRKKSNNISFVEAQQKSMQQTTFPSIQTPNQNQIHIPQGQSQTQQQSQSQPRKMTTTTAISNKHGQKDLLVDPLSSSHTTQRIGVVSINQSYIESNNSKGSKFNKNLPPKGPIQHLSKSNNATSIEGLQTQFKNELQHHVQLNLQGDEQQNAQFLNNIKVLENAYIQQKLLQQQALSTKHQNNPMGEDQQQIAAAMIGQRKGSTSQNINHNNHIQKTNSFFQGLPQNTQQQQQQQLQIHYQQLQQSNTVKPAQKRKLTDIESQSLNQHQQQVINQNQIFKKMLESSWRANNVPQYAVQGNQQQQNQGKSSSQGQRPKRNTQGNSSLMQQQMSGGGNLNQFIHVTGMMPNVINQQQHNGVGKGVKISIVNVHNEFNIHNNIIINNSNNSSQQQQQNTKKNNNSNGVVLGSSKHHKSQKK